MFQRKARYIAYSKASILQLENTRTSTFPKIISFSSSLRPTLLFTLPTCRNLCHFICIFITSSIKAETSIKVPLSIRQWAFPEPYTCTTHLSLFGTTWIGPFWEATTFSSFVHPKVQHFSFSANPQNFPSPDLVNSKCCSPAKVLKLEKEVSLSLIELILSFQPILRIITILRHPWVKSACSPTWLDPFTGVVKLKTRFLGGSLKMMNLFNTTLIWVYLTIALFYRLRFI